MSIRIEGVSKSFGPKVVLDGFTLDVRDRETMVVIGHSGSGKSVLLKLIVRLLEPDAGTIVVNGRRVGELTRDELVELRRDVGFVFQFAALFDSMTVAENVAMGLRRIREMTADAIEERVREALTLVGLSEYGSRYPAELSGGQRKRAGLARAIATHPKYLLYDEPTTGLDPVTTAVINRLILKMRDELGVTSIVVTHDLQSAYYIGDRIAMLYQGKVRFVGTPAEIQAVDDPVVRAFIEGRPELAEEVA
ncbi:MAG TPA: ABC transporter ATP-binding protein [Longimicrobiales bacterium]|nr:ABC transporter ATP-binding protein [Longimicrobiales bacterium]